MAAPPVGGAGDAGDTAETLDRSAGPAGAVGPVGRTAGPEGAAEPIGGAAGAEDGGGVTEEAGSGAAGPGRAAVEPVVGRCPEVGAPRPIRLAPLEVLRCTGYVPAPDDVPGVAEAAAGETPAGGVAAGETPAGGTVAGLLGPAAGSPGPAVALWTTAAVPARALLAVLAGAVPAPVAPTALSAGLTGMPLVRVSGLPLLLLLLRSVLGRTGPGAGSLGPVAAEAVVAAVDAAGVAAVLPEPGVARWTLTAAPLERVAVSLDPVEARWTLAAALPDSGAAPRVPSVALLGPAAVPPGVLAEPELVGAGVVAEGVAVVRLRSAAARWTLTAELVGLVDVLPEEAAAFWARTGAGPVSAAGVAPVPAVGAAPGAGVAGPDVVGAGPVVVSGRAEAVPRESAAALWTAAAPLLGAGAEPVEPAALAAGPADVPLGRVEELTLLLLLLLPPPPLPLVGRTGPGAGLLGTGAAAAEPVVLEAETVGAAGEVGEVGAPDEAGATAAPPERDCAR
ncbi:hypothetical protein AB0D14_08820 [Streptomyces sp. NPDC048484]|uniref:hypothetical protein n=1 Tax=Streptomyces sp. NPDC048484 TaxID=3155146 RepID=UPI00344AD306